MRARIGLVALGGALLFTTVIAAPAVATPGSRHQQTVSVSGTVSTPDTYTVAQLRALPQSTYPVTGFGHPRSVTGVNLEDLVTRSAPVLPAGKNTSLRVLLTVTGRAHRAETFALGELDPNFGNHPAVLTTGRDIDLVVPGDRDRRRTVEDVTGIRVAVSSAGATTVPAGAVEVITAHRTVTLSAALLAHLPRRTESVSFLAGTASQTHTESGPPLALVLLAAHVPPGPNTAVVAVGDDGYGAAVTMAEAYVGGRGLLLSLVEDGTALTAPRLVTDGDVKGGRYVSDVVELTIG
jgi:hypothetical protein